MHEEMYRKDIKNEQDYFMAKTSTFNRTKFIRLEENLLSEHGIYKNYNLL